jgi:hypothetical protein
VRAPTDPSTRVAGIAYLWLVTRSGVLGRQGSSRATAVSNSNLAAARRDLGPAHLRAERRASTYRQRWRASTPRTPAPRTAGLGPALLAAGVFADVAAGDGGAKW